jgi:hypothetical protein
MWKLSIADIETYWRIENESWFEKLISEAVIGCQETRIKLKNNYENDRYIER